MTSTVLVLDMTFKTAKSSSKVFSSSELVYSTEPLLNPGRTLIVQPPIGRHLLDDGPVLTLRADVDLHRKAGHFALHIFADILRGFDPIIRRDGVRWTAQRGTREP
jgi:hypothetical protein